MKPLRWNHGKNEALKIGRGISFKEIVLAIEADGLLDELRHPNPDKYTNQRGRVRIKTRTVVPSEVVNMATRCALWRALYVSLFNRGSYQFGCDERRSRMLQCDALRLNCPRCGHKAEPRAFRPTRSQRGRVRTRVRIVVALMTH